MCVFLLRKLETKLFFVFTKKNLKKNQHARSDAASDAVATFVLVLFDSVPVGFVFSLFLDMF